MDKTHWYNGHGRKHHVPPALIKRQLTYADDSDGLPNQ